VHRILWLTVSKALLWSSRVKNVTQFLSSLDRMSSTTSVMELLQLLFFQKPDCFSLSMEFLSIKFCICASIFSKFFDKKGSRDMGLNSAWLFGILIIFVYFHAEGKMDVVIAVFIMCLIWLRSKGCKNLINFGLLPSRPSASDFTLSKHSRTSHCLTQIKLNLLSQSG